MRPQRVITILSGAAILIFFSHVASACEVAQALTPEDIAREAERARKNDIVRDALDWLIAGTLVFFGTAMVAALGKRKRLVWALVGAAGLLLIVDMLLVQSGQRCGGGPF